MKKKDEQARDLKTILYDNEALLKSVEARTRKIEKTVNWFNFIIWMMMFWGMVDIVFSGLEWMAKMQAREEFREGIQREFGE